MGSRDREGGNVRLGGGAVKPFFKVFRFGGYPFDVAVSYMTPRQTVERQLRKIGAMTAYQTLPPVGDCALTTRLLNNTFLIDLLEPPDTPSGLGLLIHELFHAVVFLMRDVEIRLSDDSEEAFAYALQDMTQQVVTAMVPTVKRRPSSRSR